MSVLVAILCVAAAAVLIPLWASLVLAAWFADLLKPAIRSCERLLRGRRRAVGVVIVLITVAILVPLGGLVAALIDPIGDFVVQVRAALEGYGSLAGILLGGDGAGTRPVVSDWADLASRYGANAWGVLAMVGRASTGAALGVLVFGAALYTFAVDGERAYAWLEERVPLSSRELARLAGAFRETGRGLIVGAGGTALVQGALATVAYLAIGIPQALILGALTAVCALIPFVGTGLVWIPLAIELGARGQYWRVGVVVVMGVGVHSLVDNVLRPFLTRYGRLNLPTFVVLVSMIGGISVLGAPGALLGPLVMRLCVESLAIELERRRDRSASGSS